jgi:hypothetical protein
MLGGASQGPLALDTAVLRLWRQHSIVDWFSGSAVYADVVVRAGADR